MVEPGAAGALSDSAGRFRFDGLPRGRYSLTIGHIEFRSASDSVTHSEFGVRVAAVLVRQSMGDHRMCVRTPG